MNRCGFLLGALAATAAPASAADPFAELERALGGPLGIAAIDLRDGRRLGHRADERFAVASTFKFPTVATVLSRGVLLSRRVHFTEADLLDYAPVSRKHLAAGWMTVEEMCAAAIEYSDNTAANLLLPLAGGPAGVTAFVRAAAGPGFHLVHNEPRLNDAHHGDDADTTTPATMAAFIARLAQGNLLAPAQQARLLGWMRRVKTGDARFRAGVPHGWTVADKTGTTREAANDIGLFSPPSGAPIVLAAFASAPGATGDRRDAILARAARVAIRALRG